MLILVSTAAERQLEPVKWLAHYAWMHHLPRYTVIEEIGEAEERRLREAEKQDPDARRQVKILDQQKLILERAEKARKIRKESRDERKYEALFTPVTAAMAAVRARQTDDLRDHELFCFTMMAAMEVFMWGATSKETLKLIADRQAEIKAKEERLRLDEEERKRKYKEERRLREEKYQRDRDERLGVNRPAVVEQQPSAQPSVQASTVNIPTRKPVMTAAQSIARSKQSPTFQELVKDEVNEDWR